MDSAKRFHARLTVQDKVVTLGSSEVALPFETLVKRFLMEMRAAPASTKSIHLQLSVEPIHADSFQSHAVRLEHELESSIQHVDQIEEEWRPGISYDLMTQAITSQYHMAYVKARDTPGFDPLALTQLREAYVIAYPLVAPHFIS